MTKMTTTASQIWSELESEQFVAGTLLLRRFPTTVVPDVYVALSVPERFKCIAISISDAMDIDFTKFTQLRDVTVEISESGPNRGEYFLVFKLINNELEEIFSVLCDDLVSTIAPLHDQNRLVIELLNRFDKWKSLFDRATAEGLSAGEQQGLFGELTFLRNGLRAGGGIRQVLESWVGPSREIRDFQFGPSAVEVKSTHGNNHQTIRISSERQLDIANLENLFLFHLSLEKMNDAGENLNQIVDSISVMVGPDRAILNRFRSKLFEYGYFEHHRHLYEILGYTVRNQSIYRVIDDFPRIEEGDIRGGVGDVKYSIIVSNCGDFLVSPEESYQALKFI